MKSATRSFLTATTEVISSRVVSATSTGTGADPLDIVKQGKEIKKMKILSFVCAGATALFTFLAQAETVAYWPMVLDPETGGTSRTITDASGNDYDLNVALSDAQAVNTDEIPFAYPPNGPADVTISSCAEILNGTKTVANAFMRGTGNATETKDPLILAMGLCHDFTIEGYMYVKSMRHGDNADTVIVYSGMSGNGDWIWNLTEPTKGSNTRNVVVLIRSGNKVENDGVLTTIDDDEILGGWHHYALVFKFNVDGRKSQWTFYLDGVNRGSQLMTNHDVNTNQKQDRFLLGGISATAYKAFDAKFAFWRVSDEALSANAMLSHRTFNTTVAYWTMNVYTNASERIVPDVVDERNELLVRDPSKGGVSWTDNDIGWTTPPNPDAELTAAGIDCPSRMMVRSGNNTTRIDNLFCPVFSTAADAPVLDATKLTKGFTIEGFLRFTTLPGSGKNQMLVYNTYAEKGGWVWNLYGPDENGNLSMRVTYLPAQGSRRILTLCDQIRPEDLLNVWNHCALTFTPDNGNAQTEWRFYLNGRLLGNDTTMPAYVDYEFTDPKFYLSGAPTSGAGQSLIGDMTCWRVSNQALAPSAFLCGGEFPVIPADALVWKGSSDSAEWSTGDATNWDANGERVFWTDGKDAYFDDFFVRNDIDVVGEVNPSSITALDDLDVKITFNNTSAIGTGCTNIVKRGLGTLELSFNGNTVAQLLKGNCPIEVREGCLKVSAINSKGALGDASLGYEVKVCENAKLWINGRNAIGSEKAGDANDSVFTIYTNGAFDISCAGFSIQALGALDLLGGDFIAPNRCHGYGYLMVRNRLTLGCRPDRQPYVFPAVLDSEGNVTGGISIGRNTEFQVEDVTDDAASDGVFDCAVLARTFDNWQTEQTPCGFRKTGTGTMELNGTYLGGTEGSLARPSGVIAVEAGELKVNIDYRGPSKYAVAGGAYLSGTGKVSNVEFAAGAGVRVNASKTDILELADVDFVGNGVVELTGVASDVLETLKVKCAKITGTVTGAANLANWKVKVDGTEVPDLVVRASGGYLKALYPKGFSLTIR